MIAAIYARKSTDQGAVSDEQRSVTRQVEHARAFAASKGWTVDDGHVYVDDGISGAEFAARPGFVRLMNALKPKAAFDVLIMSEESRLGREAIETAYALKQLMQAGVRVCSTWKAASERSTPPPTSCCSRSRHSPTNSSARRPGSVPTTRWCGRRRPATSRAGASSGTTTSTC